MVWTNSDAHTHTHAHTPNCHCDNCVALTASRLDNTCHFQAVNKVKSLELHLSHLTHYQMTNFRLFQTERVCRRQFQISQK